MKCIKYEEFLRDYTILGVTSVMSEFFTRKFYNYYGATFTEMIQIIKNGSYYYVLREGDNEKLSRAYLQKVKRGKIDIKSECKKLFKTIVVYEKIINQPVKNYKLETILEFYNYYQQLIYYAYASFYVINVVDNLLPAKEGIEFKKYLTKIRMRAEAIYKFGEVKFIPKYCQWLRRNVLPGYKEDNLKYIFYKEMVAYIKYNKALPSIAELEDRKKILYIQFKPFGKCEFLTGRMAHKRVKEKGLLEIRKDNYNLKELVGNPAFGGYAKGLARVVNGLEEIKKFKKNEILISRMTDPNYLPIIKKARAIITDEGGLLCHAAIVSRELKKPCIIGTKIATKVLKDGDLVEVDADKGIVKILKSANNK